MRLPKLFFVILTGFEPATSGVRDHYVTATLQNHIRGWRWNIK